jgi:transcriptional regulator with XRE-family HTH domain
MGIQDIFSRNMRNYRKKAKLTQEKLAEMCGTDYRYIGQIETGIRCPSLGYVEKIAVALNVKPYLLFFDETNNENDVFLNMTSEQKQKIKAMLFQQYTQICSIIDKLK